MAIKNIRDLKVYETTYKLAMEIFEITKKFPKEEVYSLTDR
ncbi:MAG: four helix bundle protein [Candidatus Omnitrophota bacterium]|nr:four helix bundle protein [Candidatus Omnitrophota bacterium]